MDEPACMKIGDEHRSNLHWISEQTTYCESKNDFFQKITGVRSCTCSTNRTHFLPIQQTFFLFTRDGRKGLRCPGWDIVHVRWSSILEKWDGGILKQHFGGYFTKRPVFCVRKMENGFSVRRK